MAQTLSNIEITEVVNRITNKKTYKLAKEVGYRGYRAVAERE